MDIVAYNREAWNRQSRGGESQWCIPVSSGEIEAAQRGDWSVILTPNKRVPVEWFGDLKGKDVLCLASGGEQAPILAAAGTKVTSFDNSDEQLAKDKFVADRDCLDLKIVQGDMADLSAFTDESFDLIYHPVSNVFAADVKPVWRECFRVMKWRGRLLAGFMNPWFFLFDHEEAEGSGVLQVKYRLPFSDLGSLPTEKLEKIQKEGIAYEFSHSLQDQIGGQTAAGFLISDLYEDNWSDEASPLNRYCSMYIATLARKLRIDE